MKLPRLLDLLKFLIMFLEEQGYTKRSLIHSYVEHAGLRHKEYVDLVGEIREMGIEIHADPPRFHASAAEEEEQMRAIAAEAIAEQEKRDYEAQANDAAQLAKLEKKPGILGWFKR